MQRIQKLVYFSLLSSLTFSAYAQKNISQQHMIVAPQCLMQNLDTDYQSLATINNIHLIKLNETDIDKLIQAKHHQNTPCGGFMDVTNAWNQFQSNLSFEQKSKSFLQNYTKSNTTLANTAYEIKYQTEVNQLLKQINPQYVWSRLEALSSYPDRYSRSDNGVKVANEIKAEVETMAKNNGRDDVIAYLVVTGNYLQPSVVVKIGNSSEPGVVIGAHIDTLALNNFPFGNKPGADDDGSGTVTVLEVARTLLSSGMHFKKPIYLVWYAAEEMGLVGSQYVVADFMKKNIPVSEVMQLDMTGYAYQNDLTMWLIDDYVNKDLTAFLETLIKTYVKQPVKHTACGYACSDNASWSQKGYAVSMPAESEFHTVNPDIHSPRDTIEKLSLNHMTNHVILATAFAVELAEPLK